MGFTVERVLRRVLRRGSEKAVSRKCIERPLEEYAPLGVRPSVATPPSWLFPQFRVFRRGATATPPPPPKGPAAPHPEPPL